MPYQLIIAVTAWTSRIAAAGVQLFSIRLLLDGVGSEQYAVFALLTGLMVWFMLVDLGMGFSLQNTISEAKAFNRDYEDYVSAVLLVGGVSFVLFGLLFYLVSPLLGPWYLGRFSFLSAQQQATLMTLVAILFLGTGIGNIIYRVWYGEQRGHIANLVSTAASLLSFLGLWAVLRSDLSDKLFWSLFAYIIPTAGLPILAALGRLVQKPSGWRQVKSHELIKLGKRAFKFWGFAVMSATVLSVDYIVMSQVLTAQEIVSYTVVTKILGFVLTLYVSVLMVLWPVCTELCAKDQWQEVIQYIQKYILAGMATVIGITILFAFFREPFAGLFTGHERLNLPLSLIALVGGYLLIRVWTDTFAVVLQSVSDLAVLWRWVPVQAIISISLQWFLAPLYGVYGIMFGLILSFILTVAWVLPLRVMHHIKSKDQGKWATP